MKLVLKAKKEPPDGWLTIWNKAQGRGTAQSWKLSYIRSHTPVEMRRYYQQRKAELAKYHASKHKYPDNPLQWYGHPKGP